jgi:hypothetical protein
VRNLVFTYPHSVVVLISPKHSKALHATLQTMLCALTGAALLAVASGAASQHSDPEVFVGYSSKEVGYVLAEELGRLIKSNEERPANKCVLVLSPLGLPQCTRACACVRARACVLVCYHFVDRSIVPSLLHSLVHPFACISRPSVTLWCVRSPSVYASLSTFPPSSASLARPLCTWWRHRPIIFTNAAWSANVVGLERATEIEPQRSREGTGVHARHHTHPLSLTLPHTLIPTADRLQSRSRADRSQRC